MSTHILAPVVAAFGMVVVIFIFTAVWASRYRKAGPNEALIVSGRKTPYVSPDGTTQFRGFRIVKGGGTFVVPVIEKMDRLSLELLTVDLATPEMETSDGRRVKAAGKAQFKIIGDDRSIAAAAEHFLSKSTEEIKMAAAQTLENSMRAVVGSVTAEYLSQNREAFINKLQEAAAQRMSDMGLGVISFTLRDICT